MFTEASIAKVGIDVMFLLAGLSIFGLMYVVTWQILIKYFKTRYTRRLNFTIALIASCVVIFALLLMLSASFELPDQQ
jgi:hypothetical protein